ncbi:histidinol-phosphate transaminase [Oleoguttula sp. CCFEE 5521]
MRAFCVPGKDKILTCPPTYGMYHVSAQVNDVEVVKVPLDVDNGFSAQPEKINAKLAEDGSIKMVYLTSPGNPTANLIRKEDVQAVLEHPTWNGIVVLDEAYIDFSPEGSSLAEWSAEWPNLVVMQTMSKAFGLAGIRLGAVFTSRPIAELLNNMKAPYNIPNPTSQIATQALQPENLKVMHSNREAIIRQREILLAEMPKIAGELKGVLEDVYGGKVANGRFSPNAMCRSSMAAPESVEKQPHGHPCTRPATIIGGSSAISELVRRLQAEQDKHYMLLDHLTDPAHFTMATPNVMPTPSPSISIQPSQEYFGHGHYVDQSNSVVQTPNSFSNPFGLTPNASIPPTPGSIAGRKRSRGDIFHDDEEPEADGSLPTPASEAGTMPNPNAMMDDSGNVAWTQAQMARTPFELQQNRPIIPSRKSQRVCVTSDTDELAHLILPPGMREATQQPLIDEASYKLGISWTRMDSRPSLETCAAAYAKFIINHYPRLREVQVWFENRAVPCYLVQCLNVYSGNREYYLFSNDLLEAKLVTREAGDLIPRLLMLPAGIEVAAPGGTLKAEMSPTGMAFCGVSLNSLHSLPPSDPVPSTTGVQTTMPDGACAAHSMELD